jgi:hypothetical protein
VLQDPAGLSSVVEHAVETFALPSFLQSLGSPGSSLIAPPTPAPEAVPAHPPAHSLMGAPQLIPGPALSPSPAHAAAAAAAVSGLPHINHASTPGPAVAPSPRDAHMDAPRSSTTRGDKAGDARCGRPLSWGRAVTPCQSSTREGCAPLLQPPVMLSNRIRPAQAEPPTASFRRFFAEKVRAVCMRIMLI